MRTLTRYEAIDRLRRELLRWVDDEHSMCLVAARVGIFCRGLAALDDGELRERYAWIVERRGLRTRREIEEDANRWQLSQQFVKGASIACDVQTDEADTCLGWNTFSLQELERFLRDLCGVVARVVPDPEPKPSEASRSDTSPRHRRPTTRDRPRSGHARDRRRAGPSAATVS